MEMAKQQRMKNKMTYDPRSFNDDEFEVGEILLKLPQLIAQERENRDSDFPLSWVGKRTRYEIGCSSSTPSLPSPLLGPHYYRNGNASATLHPSSLSKSDSNRKKMDLLQNTLHVIENIRKLKQETSKTRHDHYEMLRLTSSMLKQMELEVSSCVKQKKLNLNSSPETITGSIELPSQASVQEGKEEKEEKEREDADGVLGQAEASGSGNLVSCSSQGTNEVKGLSDISVRVIESSSGRGFVDLDDQSEEAIAAHQSPL